MLTSEQADTFLSNMSGRTCDLAYEKGQIVIALMPDGGILRIRPVDDTFSLEQMGIVADYRIDDAGPVGCEHPDNDVEYIAQKEYPGGGVLWCQRCGAWRDDDECEWHVPRRMT